MAKCPKCKRNWLWDWEQDIYRYADATEIESIELSCLEKGMELEVIVFKCKCGSVNSVMYIDSNRGSSLCIIKEWENIIWEENKNSWDPG